LAFLRLRLFQHEYNRDTQDAGERHVTEVVHVGEEACLVVDRAVEQAISMLLIINAKCLPGRPTASLRSD
jgi:hypothetical protein